MSDVPFPAIAAAIKTTLEAQGFTRLVGAEVVAVEPGTTRKFEAASSPTTLLAIGGTPGKAYEIGDWEK